MQSVSLRSDKPLDPDKFFPWVQDLVAKDGPSILRSKGILAFKDDPGALCVPGRAHDPRRRPSAAVEEGEERVSRIVFIGRELPEQKIREGFASCVA